MENIEKENKRLKVLIVILVVVLLGLGFYHYYVTYINVDKSSEVATQNCDDKKECDCASKYYQYYEEINGEFKSREIELNANGTARWYFGGTSSGGASYKGTFIEDDNQVILTLKNEMVPCNESEPHAFSCNEILILEKIDNNTLMSVAEFGSEMTTFKYIKTNKENLKYID